MKSFVVLLTPKELRDAAEWATAHVYEAHAETLNYGAQIAIRNLNVGGIGGRTVVMCESCEEAKVTNSNHKDVTDYSAW